MNRNQRLKALAERLDGQAIEYGVNDCSMFPAQWVADVTGKELILPFYDSRDAAMKLIEDAGGLVNIWSAILDPCGFAQQHDVPEYGDVGVVETRKYGDVGVIFCDQGVACWRTDTGHVTFVSPRIKTIRKAWRVE